MSSKSLIVANPGRGGNKDVPQKEKQEKKKKRKKHKKDVSKDEDEEDTGAEPLMLGRRDKEAKRKKEKRSYSKSPSSTIRSSAKSMNEVTSLPKEKHTKKKKKKPRVPPITVHKAHQETQKEKSKSAIGKLDSMGKNEKENKKLSKNSTKATAATTTTVAKTHTSLLSAEPKKRTRSRSKSFDSIPLGEEEEEEEKETEKKKSFTATRKHKGSSKRKGRSKRKKSDKKEKRKSTNFSGQETLDKNKQVKKTKSKENLNTTKETSEKSGKESAQKLQPSEYNSTDSLHTIASVVVNVDEEIAGKIASKREEERIDIGTEEGLEVIKSILQRYRSQFREYVADRQDNEQLLTTLCAYEAMEQYLRFLDWTRTDKEHADWDTTALKALDAAHILLDQLGKNFQVTMEAADESETELLEQAAEYLISSSPRRQSISRMSRFKLRVLQTKLEEELGYGEKGHKKKKPNKKKLKKLLDTQETDRLMHMIETEILSEMAQITLGFFLGKQHAEMKEKKRETQHSPRRNKEQPTQRVLSASAPSTQRGGPEEPHNSPFSVTPVQELDRSQLHGSRLQSLFSPGDMRESSQRAGHVSLNVKRFSRIKGNLRNKCRLLCRITQLSNRSSGSLGGSKKAQNRRGPLVANIASHAAGTAKTTFTKSIGAVQPIAKEVNRGSKKAFGVGYPKRDITSSDKGDITGSTQQAVLLDGLDGKESPKWRSNTKRTSQKKADFAESPFGKRKKRSRGSESDIAQCTPKAKYLDSVGAVLWNAWRSVPLTRGDKGVRLTIYYYRTKKETSQAIPIGYTDVLIEEFGGDHETVSFEKPLTIIHGQTAPSFGLSKQDSSNSLLSKGTIFFDATFSYDVIPENIFGNKEEEEEEITIGSAAGAMLAKIAEEDPKFRRRVESVGFGNTLKHDTLVNKFSAHQHVVGRSGTLYITDQHFFYLKAATMNPSKHNWCYPLEKLLSARKPDINLHKFNQPLHFDIEGKIDKTTLYFLPKDRDDVIKALLSQREHRLQQIVDQKLSFLPKARKKRNGAENNSGNEENEQATTQNEKNKATSPKSETRKGPHGEHKMMVYASSSGKKGTATSNIMYHPSGKVEQRNNSIRKTHAGMNSGANSGLPVPHKKKKKEEEEDKKAKQSSKTKSKKLKGKERKVIGRSTEVEANLSEATKAIVEKVEWENIERMRKMREKRRQKKLEEAKAKTGAQKEPPPSLKVAAGALSFVVMWIMILVFPGCSVTSWWALTKLSAQLALGGAVLNKVLPSYLAEVLQAGLDKIAKGGGPSRVSMIAGRYILPHVTMPLIYVALIILLCLSMNDADLNSIFGAWIFGVALYFFNFLPALVPMVSGILKSTPGEEIGSGASLAAKANAIKARMGMGPMVIDGQELAKKDNTA